MHKDMLYSDIVDMEHFHHWHGFTIKTTHLTCYKHQFQPVFFKNLMYIHMENDMYVFAIFPSPRVNFAFRSPSGGDSAGPLNVI